jgi:hypothetical protein
MLCWGERLGRTKKVSMGTIFRPRYRGRRDKLEFPPFCVFALFGVACVLSGLLASRTSVEVQRGCVLLLVPFSVLTFPTGLHPEITGWPLTRYTVGRVCFFALSFRARGESMLSVSCPSKWCHKRRRPLQFTMTNARRSKQLPYKRWNVLSVV